MTGWTEEDSRAYLDIAAVAVPRRLEMLATLISLVPFSAGETPRIVELGAGEGRLASALLECFPQATLVALDGSESMRHEAGGRLARFDKRTRVASFDLAALDWWDESDDHFRGNPRGSEDFREHPGESSRMTDGTIQNESFSASRQFAPRRRWSRLSMPRHE